MAAAVAGCDAAPRTGVVSGARIVSLLPSATEIVVALGLGDSLVGRSHECDFPPWVERLPVCSESKVPAEGASRDIDQRVKAIVTEGLSVYRVDADLLRRLRPDFVVTQTQCAVCAVTPGDLDETLCAWTGGRPTILSVEPDDLSDVWGDLMRVGEALDAAPKARQVVDALRGRLDRLREQADAAGSRPSVAAIEWMDPLMAGGNWMPELIEIAGGASLLAEPGKHSPWLDWTGLTASDPDVILLLPCGFRIARTLADLGALTGNPAWSALRAVRAGRVYVADGHHYFNRPGPRLVESAEIVAEILHPDRFAFGHRGTGWVALEDATLRGAA